MSSSAHLEFTHKYRKGEKEKRILKRRQNCTEQLQFCFCFFCIDMNDKRGETAAQRTRRKLMILPLLLGKAENFKAQSVRRTWFWLESNFALTKRLGREVSLRKKKKWKWRSCQLSAAEMLYLQAESPTEEGI